MKHLIITRLAIGEPTEDWLKHRIVLFEKFCVPSIKAQSCRDFVWILAVSTTTPKWFIDRVKKIIPDARILYLALKNIGFGNWSRAISSNIPKELIRPVLLTTRLDSDDALHKDFVKEVRKIALQQSCSCAINMQIGYKLDLSNSRCVKTSLEHNHFLNLLEYKTETFKTAYCINHNRIEEIFPVINLVNKEPLWLGVCHERNLFNRPPKSGNFVQWSEIKNNFRPPVNSLKVEI